MDKPETTKPNWLAISMFVVAAILGGIQCFVAGERHAIDRIIHGASHDN